MTCDFPDGLVNDIIRNQVVEKCNSKELKKKFLREEALTLDKIQTLARSSELAELHVAKMTSAEKTRQPNDAPGRQPSDAMEDQDDVNQLRRRPNRPRRPRKQYQPRTMPKSAPKPHKFKMCYRCGGKGHTGGECLKSRNIICHDCRKRGHFAHMCKSRQNGDVRYISQDCDVSENSSSDEFVFGIGDKEKSPSIEVKIEGRPCKLLIDSGATVNCLDRKTFESICPNAALQKSKSKIYPYASKLPLKILGTANLNVQINDNEHKIKFHVVNGNCTPLIGHKSAIDSGILKI